LEIVILFIVIAIPAIALFAGVFSIFNDFYNFFAEEVSYWIKIRQPLSAKHLEILKEYCAYYLLLNASQKIEFERRVQRFMYSKRFIARSVPVVTHEMRVLISASAIQLTFALPEIYLSNFNKILIYEDSYYSQITKNHHLGEVNPRAGMIILSWAHFVHGYGDLEDGHNVAIHEMAHAIHFENKIKNDEYDFLNQQALERLELITKREIPRINNGSHFLRSYAGTNEYEFFAVTLENFFERPVELNAEIPDLYQTIASLLRQDPLNLHKFKNH
jgi:MtfA peptidase